MQEPGTEATDVNFKKEILQENQTNIEYETHPNNSDLKQEISQLDGKMKKEIRKVEFVPIIVPFDTRDNTRSTMKVGI